MTKVACRLLIFTRFPQPGQTKTRLIPVLGEAGAADIQRLMTERLLTGVRELAPSESIGNTIYYTGGHRNKIRSWLGRDLHYFPQQGRNLGERMAQAFFRSFKQGPGPVVMVGSDCPDISPALIKQSFEQLKMNDVVLGPAADGGYYLIGFRQWVPKLFRNIAWSTPAVLDQTLSICQQLQRKVVLLEKLSDVDQPEDIQVFEQARRMRGLKTISVIIPVRNEASQIPDVLSNVMTAPGVEVIVADGNSQDETCDQARAHGATVMCVSPVRARQMNLAAGQAHGDILLFLHADTRLPRGYEITARHILAQPHTAMGAFSLAIAGNNPKLNRIAGWANRRSRWLQLPYGDQAFFMRKEEFISAGGFPEIPIMEDYALVRKLKKLGSIRIAPAPATTSPRRWATLGAFRTTLINAAMLAGYHLGIKPEHLARWYRRPQT
jgi:rSAM/selenodomain-associated transferase 2/rSAM/selenodomain-associated transferase 1